MSPRSFLLVTVFTCAAVAAMPRVITLSYYSFENENNDHSNDSRVAAGPLLAGGANAPSYFVPGDVDYYRLNVTDVPSTLTVHVDGVATIVISGDPEVWLESSTGTVLAHHDDIAPPANMNCFLRYVFTTPERYYVRVQHASKSPWYYNYSNYYLYGDYQYPFNPVAVRRTRWMLYR